MLREMKLGLQRYWRWTSTGPKWHWVAGIGGPILALLIIASAVAGDPEEEQPSVDTPAIDAPATERPTATAQPPTPTLEPPTPTPTLGAQARVVRVIDGDTIEVDRALDGRATVRYIGIDTPETVAPGQPVGCLGREASDRNKALVEGKTVFLEKDVSETDQFGRLLRYVYLEDEQMVNELLVVEGFAQASTYPPDVKYQGRFTAAEQQARDANRGLWGPACAPTATAVPPTQPPPPAMQPPPPPPAPTQPPPPPSGGNCSPAYPTVCIPPPPPDLDCPDSRSSGPKTTFRRFQVIQHPDPHDFDADNDGIGCE
jgi:micrococcal nuclease